MPNTLRVRNLAQKVLWEKELTGQLSDGRWENSRPYDHWEVWSDAEVVVDPEHVGRDFYAKRDGYCFTEADLLSIVGDRMLGYVQTAVDPAYTWKQMILDLRDLRKIIKLRVDANLPVPPQPAGHTYELAPDEQKRMWEKTLTVYRDIRVDADAPARTYTMADFDVAP